MNYNAPKTNVPHGDISNLIPGEEENCQERHSSKTRVLAGPGGQQQGL